MEVTYTDGQWHDVGIIRDMNFDCDFGDTSNSFELTLHASSGIRIENGSLVYVDGTEYGGRVTRPGVRTEKSELVYGGSTWHGLLAERIICPPQGQGYFEISNVEANQAVAALLACIDAGSLFVPSTVNTGITVSAKIRYTDAWTALRTMLSSASMRPQITYMTDCVEVAAVQAKTWETDAINVEISDEKVPVNHLICLGKGNLSDRIRIDLYADLDGVISQKQSIFGIDYKSAVYDYSSADYNTLLESGTDKLKDLRQGSSSSLLIDFESPDDVYSIGDTLLTVDEATGVSASVVIGQKTVTVGSRGNIVVSYAPTDTNAINRIA